MDESRFNFSNLTVFSESLGEPEDTSDGENLRPINTSFFTLICRLYHQAPCYFIRSNTRLQLF